jgi:hypothetical protein
VQDTRTRSHVSRCPRVEVPVGGAALLRGSLVQRCHESRGVPARCRGRMRESWLRRIVQIELWWLEQHVVSLVCSCAWTRPKDPSAGGSERHWPCLDHSSPRVDTHGPLDLMMRGEGRPLVVVAAGAALVAISTGVGSRVVPLIVLLLGVGSTS